jgi:hypothetical protein
MILDVGEPEMMMFSIIGSLDLDFDFLKDKTYGRIGECG